LQTTNISKALNDGLKFRPLADTIRDTLHWNATRPASENPLTSAKPRAGMMQEREKNLLNTWKQRQN
jgi:2'-hydroxyisoflavone reductase